MITVVPPALVVMLAALTVFPIVVVPVLLSVNALRAVPEPTLPVKLIAALPVLIVKERAMVFATLETKFTALFVVDNVVSDPKLTAVL